MPDAVIALHPASRGKGRPRLRRFLVPAVSIAGVCLVAWVAQAEVVLVTGERNGELAVASHLLREDGLDHPRLRLLRTRERLDEVIAAGKSQFEKIVLLRAWAHRQWQPGGNFYYPPWDAVEILDLARNHGNRGFCAQYAIVFLQACQSLGLHARYVDLPEHFVVAVWSDDHNRWVVMDPTNDIHFEKDGAPMRGRELCGAYWKDDVAGIELVDSAGRRKAASRDDLARYRQYSIGLSANQLSDPPEVKSNGRWRRLVHARDYRTYPRIGRDRLEVASRFLAWRTEDTDESFPRRPETGDQDEFRNALNQVVILLANERLNDRILKIALLSDNSPTFERFLIRSEKSTEWVPTSSPTFKWMLHPGMNELSARVETRHGWRGTVSSLRMLYKPPLIGFLPASRGNILWLLWHRLR